MIKLIHGELRVLLNDVHENLSLLVICGISFNLFGEELAENKLENFVVLNLSCSNGFVRSISLIYLFTIPFVVIIVEISVCELLHGVITHVTERLDRHETRFDVSSDQRRLNLGQNFIMRELKPVSDQEISLLLFGREFVFIDHPVLLFRVGGVLRSDDETADDYLYEA
jgi:hypothetical protein